MIRASFSLSSRFLRSWFFTRQCQRLRIAINLENYLSFIHILILIFILIFTFIRWWAISFLFKIFDLITFRLYLGVQLKESFSQFFNLTLLAFNRGLSLYSLSFSLLSPSFSVSLSLLSTSFSLLSPSFSVTLTLSKLLNLLYLAFNTTLIPITFFFDSFKLLVYVILVSR